MLKNKRFLLLSAAVLIILTGVFCIGTNRLFTVFCDEIFREDIAANTLTLHYTLRHPENYGIDTSNVTLGEYTTDSSEREAWLRKTLQRLQLFPRFLLKEDQQITRDLLCYTLETELSGIPYLLYDEPLTPSIGIQSQMPVLLAEFSFSDTDDIETYLQLLADFQNYMDSLIAFEGAKLEAGMFMDLESAREIITFCQDFCSLKDDHFLYDTFSLRLENVELTTAQAEAYCKQNASLLQTVLFPAYEKLQQFLENALPHCQETGGVCRLPDGTDYYAWLLRSRIGTDRSFLQIEALLDEAMAADLKNIQTLIQKNPTLLTKKHTFSIDTSKTAELAEKLRKRTFVDFPEIPEVSLRIEHVPTSMAEYLSPAFYLTPVIDDYEENIVYLNDASLTKDLSFFTTLAHESYPGHLYQTIYENTQNHHPVRKLCYFGGYVEGWATYAEQYSYQMTTMDEDLASLLASNQALTLNLYSHLDLYIHGYGWTEAQCASYLKKYGVSQNSVHDIFMLVKQQPANYLKYYLGCLEICKLKEQCETALGKDFVLKDFHEFLLSYGPAPFSLLETYLEEWLEKR